MRKHPRTTSFLLALLALAIAAPAADASAGGAAAPSPVRVATGAHHVRPVALATWFGPGFYGHRTACGQTLTPAVLGVANRTLPCGTLISLTYGGRTVTVPVLDRGPYGHNGADWDLTAGTAAALGVTETVRVRARVVGIAANTPTLGLPAALVSAGETLAGGSAPPAG